MKEVLYKAKRKDNGEWVYGYYIELNNTTPLIYTGEVFVNELGLDWEYRRYTVDPRTLCEYIGIEDMYGKKIFCGDILELQCIDSESKHYECIFNEEECCYTFKEVGKDVYENPIDLYDEYSGSFMLGIISNIHNIQ